MIDLSDIRTAILAHAEAEAPRECCGLLVIRSGRLRYLRCRNQAPADRLDSQFVLSPEDYAAAEDHGDVLAVVHSHPYMPPTPSQADLVGCEQSGLPWVIVNWPVGSMRQIEPCGYHAPLVGRPFVHGVLDCYSLVRDYYASIRIDLPDFARADGWWERGGDLYREHFQEAGFVRVDDAIRLHDVFLVTLRSTVPNHAAVFVGDGRILHHPAGRLSGHEMYDGYWRQYTWGRVRHRSLI